MKFSEIPEVLEELRQGRMIDLVDAEDRENEGDLVCAAEKVTAESINFMAKFGRGLICLPLTAEKCDSLGLYPQTIENTARFETAFTVSIDAAEGVTTGISTADRAHTIKVAIADGAKASELVRPGHIFPLRARKGGVLVRAGQTEGAVDLMRLAGLKPAGVICGIMNEDGSMARVPQLLEFCVRHNLKIASIAKLIEYRLQQESQILRKWYAEHKRGEIGGRMETMREKKELIGELLELRKILYIFERVYFRLVELEGYYHQGYGRGQIEPGLSSAAFFNRFDREKQVLSEQMAEIRYITKLYAIRNDGNFPTDLFEQGESEFFGDGEDLSF